MTIYKVNNQEKNEKKDILEQKLLAAVVTDPELPAEVDVVPPPRRHSKAWLNLFLILVAILVLAAGITGGVLLYRRLSHKTYKNVKGGTSHLPAGKMFKDNQGTSHLPAGKMFKDNQVTSHLPAGKMFKDNQITRGRCGFRADLFEQQNDIKTEEPVKEPHFLPNLQTNQQWSDGKTMKPSRRPNKHHRHHKHPHMVPYDLSEDVQVIDDQIERIHMPSFRDFRDTMILHDFQKNYTAIVDYDKRSCYVMKLDRSKVTPPKDWIDLIQKFATGYYMPRADVLRKQYRVTLPALKDISFLGRYIEKECTYFQTYTMERMVGDHFIAKRAAGGVNHGALYSYYEPQSNKFIQMELFKRN